MNLRELFSKVINASEALVTTKKILSSIEVDMLTSEIETRHKRIDWIPS
jgi:hypothetical protein